jgi:cytochrome P450 family 2 subfamily J
MSQLQTLLWTFVTRARAFEREILVALVVLVVAYFAMGAWREWRSNLPPGPYGLPILGYLPFLSLTAPHLDFLKLGKKYGDIFRLKLGSETVIVIHGVEVIKEALSRPEFLGRPEIGVLKLFNEGSAFFYGMDVHKWREQRRFVLQSMRDLGLGKSLLEGEISEEIHYFLDKLRSHNGVPMDVKDPLSPSMSNNISSLVFGKRYEYEDPDRVFLDKHLDIVANALSSTSVAGFFPWILKVPLVSKLFEMERACNSINETMTFFRKEIKKHKETFDPKNIRDFIDSFIGEQDSRKLKDPNTTFTDDTLASNVFDLFAAGSETVRTSILWNLYVACAFPEHQERIKEEILEVMGPDRDPEYQDMKSMPFTHSYILEVLRWKTIVPVNVAHSTLSDTTIGGYHIPKNVTVFTMLWNAHNDPNYWTNPEKFIPDRFITKDGKSVSKPAHYMPFSMGKRVCPGEPMAMMELFLYFTSIIQKFQVVFPAGYKPTFEAAMGGTYRLEPYTIRFLSRS